MVECPGPATVVFDPTLTDYDFGPSHPMTPLRVDLTMRLAEELGVGHTYQNADVGVLFGEEPGVDVPDPYFGGAGPARTTCLHCGECMTGCRHGAKNTVAKNYLYLAEAAGAVIHELSHVTRIDHGQHAGATSRVHTEAGSVLCDHVILAANGYLGRLDRHVAAHSGMFPCLRGARLERLERRCRSARATCTRVCEGSITAST